MLSALSAIGIEGIGYLFLALVAVIFTGLGLLIFYLVNKKRTERKMREDSEEAKNIVELAREDAKLVIEGAGTRKKDLLVGGRGEAQLLCREAERESRDRRVEIKKDEQRLISKEDVLDKKEQVLNKRNEQLEQTQKHLAEREKELEKKSEEVGHAHDKMLAELEKVAGMTKEEAKSELIAGYEQEAKKDAVKMVRDIENEAKNEGQKKAREIISLAIQKCAADHASEGTVSVVPLPSDDMKGRIIGREGRNIRALEAATGIDLIIDDTPEVVILSGFDPIRREVARVTLEKLIVDGRIHPARIEETVEKVKRDVENQIKEAGDAAVFDTGVYGLHPELVKLLGRLKFRTSYGQNILKHSLEVAFLAATMAGELGADVALAKRAGLLHDIGKAVDFELEGTHIQIGADLAKKYRESKEVVNAIMAHHGDVEPLTVEAVLVQAADAISGARPGARRESLENYVKRLEKLEEIADSFPGVEKSFAIQAGREVRVMVKPEVVDDTATVFLAKEVAKKIEAEMEYPGQIKVNVIREMRSVEYAK